MAKRRNRAVDLVVYLSVRCMHSVLSVMPERLVYPLASSLGRLFFRLASGRRAIALAFIEQALGPSCSARARERIGSRASGNAFKIMVDLAKMYRAMRRSRLSEVIETSAMAVALAEADRSSGGKPAILCIPHIGSWEAGSVVAPLCGLKLHVIARPLGNPWLNEFLTRKRSRLGQRIHPRRGGIRSMKRALEQGEPVCFLPDQNQRLRGVFVPFFGRLASCDRSPVSLALMGGHPIIVAGLIRVGSTFRFKCEVADVFLPSEGGGTREERLHEGLLRLHAAVEKLVLAHPEQYFWLHNRYRTRPQRARMAEKESA